MNQKSFKIRSGGLCYILIQKSILILSKCGNLMKSNGCVVKAICSKDFETCKYYKKHNRVCKYYEYKNSDSLCNSIDAIDEALQNKSF